MHELDREEMATLQYHLELWSADGKKPERVIAASVRPEYVTRLVEAAARDFPINRVIVRQGARVLADSRRD